jgi:hypothetical protein
MGALRGVAAGAAAALTGATLASVETAAKSKKGQGKKGKGKKGKGAFSASVAGDNTVDYTGQGRGCDPDTDNCVCVPNSSTCCAKEQCGDGDPDDTMLFILNGFENDTTAVSITGPFGSFDCVQKGGGAFQCQVPLVSLDSLCEECSSHTECSVSATYNGTATDPGFTLSHACGGCVPEICPPDKVIGHDDKCTFSDGCDGTYDCPCDTTCEDKTTGNYACKDGTCVCKAEECAAGKTIAHGEACTFSDGCCGDYKCPCDTTCSNGTTSEYECKGGKCTCDPKTCPTSGYAGDPCGSDFDDHCCGTYECKCKQTCPDTATPAQDVTKYTNGNTCTDGTCACTPTDAKVACAGKCGQTVDDGCCGTIQCPVCCDSCTQGYYKQNQCTKNGSYSWGSGARPSDALTTICPGGSAIQAYCISKGHTTIGKALAAKGNDVICAQFAAAYLNQRLDSQHEDCTTVGIGDICALANTSASNSTLSFWNQGGEQGYEICPNKGCGTS